MKTSATTSIPLAAKAILAGNLVAFPTETVYGLGANAFDASAVRKIFRAKRRPADNPVIVHIHDRRQVADIATNITPKVRRLMNAFFPGPLTLVLTKSRKIPPEVTAGLSTVCVRMPSLTQTRRFLRACGVPVAAPSANLSGRPSPTTWRHVMNDLGGRIPLILKGPAALHGIESTIVDCTRNPPAILRPGAVSRERIERQIGRVELGKLTAKAASPGLKHRHYSPDARVVLTRSASQLPRKRGRWAFIGFSRNRNAALSLRVRDARHYARALYSFFRHSDALGLSPIYAELPDSEGIGLALRDRLERAAAR